MLHTLKRDRGMSLEFALSEYKYQVALRTDPGARREERGVEFEEDGMGSGFYTSYKLVFGRLRCLLAIWLHDDEYLVFRPAAGTPFLSLKPKLIWKLGKCPKMRRHELLDQNRRVQGVPRVQWEQEYESPVCIHNQMHCCEMGARNTTHYLLCGSVVRFWRDILTHVHESPSVVRAEPRWWYVLFLLLGN